jgi:hypothetical protein
MLHVTFIHASFHRNSFEFWMDIEPSITTTQNPMFTNSTSFLQNFFKFKQKKEAKLQTRVGELRKTCNALIDIILRLWFEDFLLCARCYSFYFHLQWYKNTHHVWGGRQTKDDFVKKLSLRLQRKWSQLLHLPVKSWEILVKDGDAKRFFNMARRKKNIEKSGYLLSLK